MILRNSTLRKPKIDWECESVKVRKCESAKVLRNSLNVCVIQPELHPHNTEENLLDIQRMIESAAKESALDLVVLPENFVMWGSEAGKERDPAPIIDFLADLAKTYSSFLIGGSFHRLDISSNEYFNTCFVFNRQGEIIGSYSKRKLYDRELKFGVSPGVEPGIFEIEEWRVGILICADLWYPELSRAIIERVDIIAVPAQSVVRNSAYQKYGRYLWHALALTRAQENAVVTLTADHPALPRKPFCSGGYSICDPSMSMETSEMDRIQLKDSRGEPGFLIAMLDYRRLSTFRQYRADRGLLPNYNDNH